MSPPPPQEGFLSRWSRRKAQQQGPVEPAAAEPAASRPGAVPAVAVPAAAVSTTAVSTTVEGGTVEATPTAQTEPTAETPPPPTLDDVEKLDAQSDYRAFVTREVDPEVRNAALKKLFHSDPHFNVMDGLDVYIDDYNTPNPLPVAIMKTLVQARALGLIDDELKEQELPPPDRPAVVATDSETVTDTVKDSETESETESEPAPVEAGPAQVQDAVADVDSPASSRALAATGQPLETVLSQANDGAEASAGSGLPFPSTAPAAAATVAGNVVPFPRRPGPADPA